MKSGDLYIICCMAFSLGIMALSGFLCFILDSTYPLWLLIFTCPYQSKIHLNLNRDCRK